MYMTVKICIVHFRPSLCVNQLQARQPNTAPAVAIDTIQPFVLAYSVAESLSSPNLVMNDFMTTTDAMFPALSSATSSGYKCCVLEEVVEICARNGLTFIEALCNT